MLAEFTMEELCQQADLIVEGHVKDTNISKGRLIVADDISIACSRHVVVIDNILKRPKYQVASQIFVVTLGATGDKISEEVEGEAKLEKGKDVILFLSKDFPVGQAEYTIFGGFQGKYAVVDLRHDRYVFGALVEDGTTLKNFRRIVKTNLGQGTLTATV